MGRLWRESLHCCGNKDGHEAYRKHNVLCVMLLSQCSHDEPAKLGGKVQCKGTWISTKVGPTDKLSGKKYFNTVSCKSRNTIIGLPGIGSN